jgi:hypothetical protein
LVTLFNAACCSTGTRGVFYREYIIIHRICLVEDKQEFVRRIQPPGLRAVSLFTQNESWDVVEEWLRSFLISTLDGHEW